ncbi:uncharacterized protein LOC126735629 isoform X2 [Anthonomus grandis grandis]|uniref:uncharacterized protein LOC126735629 isoform X2 n=1 Tax=Anthonomus grandis grandis TaxID=2921223 RepID=UPI0021665400|nr:uncharacterized protein LOC126735629 isoform X2 [Anthonomus grandis grandis]
MYKINLVVFLLVSVSIIVKCETINEENGRESTEQESIQRGRDLGSYMGLVSCAITYDVSCFVNAAEEYLENKRIDLLAEADAQALQSGRSDSAAEKPSSLAHMIAELTKLFENGIVRFFTKEINTEDDEENVDNTKSDNSTDISNEARGHKKKKHEGLIKKIIRTVKTGIYALVFAIKLITVLMMFNSFVGFKMLMVAMWGLALFAVKIWILHKNGNEPVVIHEDVHHDHHYEDEGHYEHLPVDDWHAHRKAYSAQKPSSSWNSWLDK